MGCFQFLNAKCVVWHTVVLKFGPASKCPRELGNKHRLLGSTLRTSDSLDLGEGLRIPTSGKFLGGADAVSSGITL